MDTTTMIIVMICFLNLLNLFNGISTTTICPDQKVENNKIYHWNFVCILYFNQNQMENDRKINFNSCEVG